MKVELVSYTLDPVKSIESAASNCYDSIPTDGKIMNSCYDSGHMSVLEFAQFQFKISDISRACSHQLVRHRTGKYAQRSQRRCDNSNFTYVIPQTIYNPLALRKYQNLMKQIADTYTELVEEYDIPEEDARYVLPNACDTVIEVSFDLRNLIHFCNERLCTKAQWEIRALAKEMVRLVIKLEPKFKSFLVPKCESNKDYPFCTESKSCGRHKKLSELYNK